jgi:hypothetical protein
VVRAGGGVVDGEDGVLKILTMGADCSSTKTRSWAAIWLRPLWEPDITGRYRFEVTGDTPSQSDEFSVNLKSSERPHPVGGSAGVVAKAPPPPKVRTSRKRVRAK